MTRKDFELIARIIQNLQPAKPQQKIAFDDLVTAFAHGLKSTNPYYDSGRFTRACYYDKETTK